MENIDKSDLKNIEETLTSEMKGIEKEVLGRASAIAEKDVSLHSLHGFLGGKNNKYVDSIRTQFPSPDDFISQWIRGLLDIVQDIENKQKSKYGRVYKTTSSHRIVRLVRDPIIRNYLIMLLTRNFYRNLIERTRAKPNDVHWSLWFGDNQIPWGFIIAPAYRNGQWANDVSEIRRATYMYWTIGHVLATGLIDPENDNVFHFKDLDGFVDFYRSVLKRLSRSQYEKEIVDLYLEYLYKSQEPNQEPFLIPELRYAGLDQKHLYRLDFSVLNSHTMEYIGFELSPHSTHMAVSGMKDKNQKEVNEEIKKKWNKEIAKRNDYFLEYGITTITFSDDQLEDIGSCFKIIEDVISKRPKKSLSLKQSLIDLETFSLE